MKTVNCELWFDTSDKVWKLIKDQTRQPIWSAAADQIYVHVRRHSGEIKDQIQDGVYMDMASNIH